MTNFDQSNHPRNAPGSGRGGQFAAKANSSPEVELRSSTSPTPKTPDWSGLAANTSIPEMTSQRAAILDSARNRAYFDAKNSRVIGSGDIGPADALLVAKSFHPDAEYVGHNQVGLPVYHWAA